ncbi:MAG: MFS transporter, partial [Candidatus Aphodousia sp.]|nr:MFS transporter [Candidatus Aphodousia sp.]
TIRSFYSINKVIYLVIRALPSTPTVIFILVCIFLDALGIGLIVPVLPHLIGTLTDSGREQALWFGALLTTFGLTQFFFLPILGALSDRIGRRPVLLGGILGLGIMFAVPAFCTNLWALLLSRIAGGMLSANFSVAQAYIADIVPNNKRATYFGKIAATFGAAFTLGPAAGGLLAQIDIRLPFIIACVLCVLNFLYGAFVLPESLQRKKSRAFNLSELNPLHGIVGVIGKPQSRLTVIVLLLCAMAQNLLHSTWALFAQIRFNWMPVEIGLSVFAMGVSIALCQGALLPKILGRFNERKTVTIGLGVGLGAFLLTAASTWSILAAAALCLYAFSGTVVPTLQGYLSRLFNHDKQGSALGAAAGINSLAGALSPILGTALMVHATSMPTSPLAGMPYYACAVLLATALLLSMRLKLSDRDTR